MNFGLQMVIKEIIKRLKGTFAYNFVPKHIPANVKDADALRNFINKSQKIAVITGAGISTESGIPDYRSEDVGLYARSKHKPILYVDFLKSHKARQKYWARNYVGWSYFSQRAPNITHYAIRNLENLNKVECIVTQNVDNLHFKAGSEAIELHGSAYRVICLNCYALYDRHYIQEILKELNPSMPNTVDLIRPDGDIDLPSEVEANFKQATCNCCSGILKPDIVFFGDNVPKERVNRIKDLISKSDSLLILGSSLTVFSAYRFVLQGVEEQKKIAIVNIGATRADNYANLKISAKCSDMLQWLV